MQISTQHSSYLSQKKTAKKYSEKVATGIINNSKTQSTSPSKSTGKDSKTGLKAAAKTKKYICKARNCQKSMTLKNKDSKNQNKKLPFIELLKTW